MVWSTTTPGSPQAARGGGAFSATASITGANAGAFSEGVACGGGATTTLDSGDSYTNTIANPNLAPGTYCSGAILLTMQALDAVQF
jgi:hypothetical protein